MLPDEGFHVTTFGTSFAMLQHLRTRATPVTVLFDYYEPLYPHQSLFIESLINDPALRRHHTYLLMTTTPLPKTIQKVVHRLHLTIVYKPFDLADFLTTISHAAQYTMLRERSQRRP